ncbi:MAG TPA: hypothetical protein VHI93_05040, partial [Candidatus Thermoplasmatota archaeon]|nr:hypothetical protein [Candidatus Thermoplasmatota archaeon]
MPRTTRRRLAAMVRGAARRLALGTLLTAVASVALPTLSPPPAAAWTGGSTTFNCTASQQTYTIPAGVTILNIQVWGAQGGGANGGKGAWMEGSVVVSPGGTLKVQVGCRPGGSIGGWPDGGNGASDSYGGGGTSGVWLADGQMLMMAAGGGGAGNGGAAGGPGTRLCCGDGSGAGVGAEGRGGEGGHQLYPGAGGGGPTVAPVCPCGSGGNGTHRGGNITVTQTAGGNGSVHGGGGGGGFNGGGAGGYGRDFGGGGGGGTSVVNTTYMTDSRSASGVKAGDGRVILSAGNPEAPTTPTLVSPADGVRLPSTTVPS